MKILNLFAGIGGNRSLWEDDHYIVAIENNYQIAKIYKRRFPNDLVIVVDAYQYLQEHFKVFDFIWASPPCTTHTKLQTLPDHKKKIPDLRIYSIIIFLSHFFKGFWLVENVTPFYKSLIKETFKLGRHFFWSNFSVNNKKYPKRKQLRYSSIEDLKELHHIDDVFLNMKSYNIRKILRNMVRAEIGKYILDSINNKTLDDWLRE